MYELLGISLVLATLLTVNGFASVAAAGLWRLLEKPTRRWAAGTRAEILFAMRVGPPSVALICVAAFLVPSYLAYEPYSTGEFVSNKLATLAMFSAVGIVLALWRGFRSWRATRSLSAGWLRIATPITLSQTKIPTFRLPHSFPIIAVVGTLRPRLFIAERVLESLSQEELMAAIAHECGHLAARDNLKRMLMRASRDLLTIVPCGRSIDRAWAENAESAADEHAALRGPAQALNLASALIGIARMVPAGARPSMPSGAFILGDQTNGVMGRVNRLLALAGAGRPHSKSRRISWVERIGFVALSGVVVLTLAHTHALASLHVAMERIVQALT
jgi:Zn-dependent protease with chaperone function